LLLLSLAVVPSWAAFFDDFDGSFRAAVRARMRCILSWAFGVSRDQPRHSCSWTTSGWYPNPPRRYFSQVG